MTFAEKILGLIRAGEIEKAIEAAEKQVFDEALRENPTEARRYRAAKRFMSKANDIPAHLVGTWQDEAGRQCFTDGYAAIRLMAHIARLPERTKYTREIDMNIIFEHEVGCRSEIMAEKVKWYIAQGRLHKDTPDDEGGNVIICNVRVRTYLLGMVLEILGAGRISAHEALFPNGNILCLSNDNGEAMIAPYIKRE